MRGLTCAAAGQLKLLWGSVWFVQQRATRDYRQDRKGRARNGFFQPQRESCVAGRRRRPIRTSAGLERVTSPLTRPRELRLPCKAEWLGQRLSRDHRRLRAPMLAQSIA